MKQLPCETCRWRESEIGFPSPCPTHQKPKCFRCNDNGCPACDGTKGSKYKIKPVIRLNVPVIAEKIPQKPTITPKTGKKPAKSSPKTEAVSQFLEKRRAQKGNIKKNVKDL